MKLHAKWTFGDAGKVVNEEDLTIAPTGPANTAFHISKKTPWPAGKYKVEISADGACGRQQGLRGQEVGTGKKLICQDRYLLPAMKPSGPVAEDRW